MQKFLLLAALLISTLAGLVAVPVMSRHLPAEAMAAVSMLLLLVVLLGVFDVLRPNLTRAFVSHGNAPLPIRGYLRLSVRVALGMSAAMLGLGMPFFLRFFSPVELTMLWLGAFCFLFSVMFWAVLDGRGRVGAAQLARSLQMAGLYSGFALLAVTGGTLSGFCLVFLVAQVLLVAVLFLLARRELVWQEVSPRIAQGEVWHTMQVNFSRLFIDFIDRLVLARVADAMFISAYALTYDAASKVNIVPQYVTSFLYPRLCEYRLRDSRAAFLAITRRVLLLALANFTLIVLLACAISPFADRLVMLYLGGAYAARGHLLVLMLAVTAMFSTAFYGQAWLRAEGRFRELAMTYRVAMLTGLLLGGLGWYLWREQGLVLAVLALKSPGASLLGSMAERVWGRIGLLLPLVMALVVSGLAFLALGSLNASAFAFVCALLPACVARPFMAPSAESPVS